MKEPTKPMAIRKSGFDLLPRLCQLLTEKMGVTIGKTDANTIAVKMAVEALEKEKGKEK